MNTGPARASGTISQMQGQAYPGTVRQARRWRQLGGTLAVMLLLTLGFGMVAAVAVTIVVHWPLYLIPGFAVAGFGLDYAAARLMSRVMHRSVAARAAEPCAGESQIL